MDNANSYLSILLNDIEQIKNFLAAYNNQILYVKASYPSQELEDNVRHSAKTMSDQEKLAIINTIGLFRTYATRAYIGFNSIKDSFKSKNKKILEDIETNYQLIKTVPIPNYEACEQYTQLLSNITAKEINVESLINIQQKASDLAQASETPGYD